MTESKQHPQHKLLIEFFGSLTLAMFIAVPMGLAAYSDGADGLGIGMLYFALFAAIIFGCCRIGNKLFAWATKPKR